MFLLALLHLTYGFAAGHASSRSPPPWGGGKASTTDSCSLDELFEHASMLQAKVSIEASPADAVGLASRGSGAVDGMESVLFTVWTDSNYYDTRLKGILQTWGKKIPAHRFMAVSDKRRGTPGKRDPGSLVEETDCPPHSHGKGACCKWAKGLQFAQQRMEQNPLLNWAFFADDDVYLRTDAIASMLKSHDTEKPVALGIFRCQDAQRNCPPGKEPTGLCGGGGVAMNRAAMAFLATGDKAGWLMEQEMNHCKKCGNWADIALSMVLKERGIEMRNVEGLHEQLLEEHAFREELTHGKPRLGYHYESHVNQLLMLHELFTGEKLLSEQNGPCADFKGRRACAFSHHPKDVPFRLAQSASAGGKRIIADAPIAGFEGPFRDDIPGLGDLGQVHTENLTECAAKCKERPNCRSFEHSPRPSKLSDVRGNDVENCQLNSGTNRCGIPWEDYSLYILKESDGL